MGGGGKSGPKISYVPEAIPQAPSLSEAEEKRLANEAEREKRRKAAISSSGRASSILAGEDHQAGNIKKVLGR